MSPHDLYHDLPPLVVTPFAQLSVLAVDDHAPSLALLVSQLEAVWVGRVLKASDISGAIKELTAGQAQIDCIICDHSMDIMSGLALLQRIQAARNLKIPRDLRFILVTENADEPLVRTAIQLDVNGFLLKPLATDEVTKALVYAFSRNIILKSPGYYAQTALPGTSSSSP